MDGFISWAILGEYASFVTIIFMLVEFTKGLSFIQKVPTKYWSAFLAFTLLILTNLHANTFSFWNIVLYALSAISISLGANGLANFNSKKQDTSNTIDTSASVNATDATNIVTDVPPTTPTV